MKFVQLRAINNFNVKSLNLKQYEKKHLLKFNKNTINLNENSFVAFKGLAILKVSKLISEECLSINISHKFCSRVGFFAEKLIYLCARQQANE